MKKEEALAEFLKKNVGLNPFVNQVSVDEYEVEGPNGQEGYAIYTDGEAQEACGEVILNCLWAFKPDFLAGYMPIPEQAIACMQQSEDASNDWLLALIKNKDEFIRDAIEIDGRGHYLASYDGVEHEQGEFFIYRTN